MTPLEDRLRAASADAFPPTPDLAGWATELTEYASSIAQPWRRPPRPRRIALALLLVALLLAATALAIPGIRRALGISAHVKVVVVRVFPSLPHPSKPSPRTLTFRGRFLIKFATPDTHIHRLRTKDARGVFLEGGRHMLVVVQANGQMAPIGEDTGNTLVFERHGTVTKVAGVPDLRAARARMRSRSP